MMSVTAKAVYTSIDDKDLVSLLRQGDHVAFTEIFNRYSGLLYVFAYKKISDREEAKDIVHEMFANLWEKRESIIVEGVLLAYLFTTARNKIFDLYKHKKVSDRYLDQFQEYLDMQVENTDYLVRHNDLSALIEKEIAALPEKMRVVFELSRKTNLSRKEIALELGLSEQTVKSHMHHALKILKNRLGIVLVLAFFLNS